MCPNVTCDHKSFQDYFRNHFNPAKGLRNFKDFRKTNTNVRIPQVSNHAMKLNHACNMKMTLNNALIGSTTCMSEVLSVRLEDNTILKIKIFYDTQSQHSMCSRAVHKIIKLEWTSPDPIKIITLMGTMFRKRNFCILQFSPGKSLECIILEDLKIQSVQMVIPSQWEHLTDD